VAVALIKTFTPSGVSNKGRVHGEVECGYAIFESEGNRYLQLDTYGSADRVIPGKVSQTVQLDESAAKELLRLIRHAFPGI
jgi:hypothetical protein